MYHNKIFYVIETINFLFFVICVYKSVTSQAHQMSIRIADTVEMLIKHDCNYLFCFMNLRLDVLNLWRYSLVGSFVRIFIEKAGGVDFYMSGRLRALENFLRVVSNWFRIFRRDVRSKSKSISSQNFLKHSVCFLRLPKLLVLCFWSYAKRFLVEERVI